MSYDDPNYLIPYKYDEVMESRKWVGEIPFIQFPPDWKIKIIPPFMGAIVRFLVHMPGMPEKETVSVYLDCYSRLGFYGSSDKNTPHWEVYPVRGDNMRCKMEDIDELLRLIADRSEPERKEE